MEIERDNMSQLVTTLPQPKASQNPDHIICAPKQRTLSSSAPMRLRRKVEFASTLQINIIERKDDSACPRSWYSSRDYAIFGKDAKNTVKIIRRGRSMRKGTMTGRGLEKYFSAHYHKEKKQRELSHYRFILGEQQRQRNEGSSNPKLLRILSVWSSKWACLNALELAKYDESQVNNNCDNDELNTPEGSISVTSNNQHLDCGG